MKVVILTSSFPVAKHIVSGVFIERLARYLATDVEVEVVAPAYCDNQELTNQLSEGREIDATPFKLFLFRYAPRKWQRLAHIPGGIPVALRASKVNYLLVPGFLASMLVMVLRRALHADVLHANWSALGVVAGIAGLLTGTPVITTFRGEDVNRLNGSLLARLLMSLCLMLNAKVVTVSDAIASQIRSAFPTYSDNILLIPNGVDSRFLEPAAVRSDNELRILTVASLIPRKAIDLALQAFARVESSRQARFTIIGDGAERENLTDLISTLNIENSVEMIGEVDSNEVLKYLAKTDIFILSSKSEGRPNVVLEAMAAAVPVVAFDIPGVNELVFDGKTGCLAESFSVESLTEKLELLADNPALRSELAHGARQFIIENNLLWEKTAESYIAVYEAVT